MTRVERHKTCLSEARNASPVFLQHSDLECQIAVRIALPKSGQKHANNIKNYQGWQVFFSRPCFLEAAVASASSALDMINMDQYGTFKHFIHKLGGSQS